MLELFRKGKEQTKKHVTVLKAYDDEDAAKYYIDDEGKTVKELIAPEGVNTYGETYITVDDRGQEIYVRGFQVVEMPLSVTMGITFSELLNYRGLTSTVYVRPLATDESKRKVKKRINVLTGELMQAAGDPVRAQEIQIKLEDVKNLNYKIDDGRTKLYDVGFLFLLRRDTLDELNRATTDLVSRAQNNSIILGSTYAAHKEAFISSFPFNSEATVNFGKLPVGKKLVMHHLMDDESLSTIYNHISSDYFHENGVLLGENLSNHAPITYNIFKKNAIGYATVVFGTTGYGKSCGLKCLLTRHCDFGGTVVSIDYDTPDGNQGEYCDAAAFVGGINIAIGSSTAKNHINLFEVRPDSDYNRSTKVETEHLRLNQKAVDIANVLITLAFSNVTQSSGKYDPALIARSDAIIKDIVMKLYNDRGIFEEQVESLYEPGTGFGRAHVRKHLPTMKDFYLELYRQSVYNQDKFKEEVYRLLLDLLKGWVRELYYCKACFETFTKEEYEALPGTGNGKKCHAHKNEQTGETEYYEVEAVVGTTPYFDYESDILIDDNVPWVNFDISGAPDNVRPALNLVVINYINENFVKRNSANPQKAKKLVVMTDEFHLVLANMQTGAAKAYETLYRLSRKHYCAPFLVSQSIADFNLCEETRTILTQSKVKWLYNHSPADRAAIREHTELTESQVNKVIAQGGTKEHPRPGEVCIIDDSTRQVTFCRVDYWEEIESQFAETNTEKRRA